MKKNLVFIGLVTLLYACGSEPKPASETQQPANSLFDDAAKAKEANSIDAKGIGKFTDVEVAPTLDAAMADAGGKVYDLKCASCHRLTDEKLVGPGWKGVTSRRSAAWIMNFSTNTDEMINNDPAAQAMLEECLVRMPNQSLTDQDARDVYEYMRQNDGVK